MDILNIILIVLILAASTLFLVSRRQLARTKTKVARKERMTEMIHQVLKYEKNGKSRQEVIERVKKDFKLGDQEAEYLYRRAEKYNKEERK